MGTPFLWYCEEVLKTGIAQPANASSSIFIIFLSVVVFWQFIKKKSIYVLLLALGFSLAGLSTLIYHIYYNFPLEVFDLFTIYFLFSILLASFIQIRKNLSAKQVLSIVFRISIISSVVYALLPPLGLTIHSIGILYILMSHLKSDNKDKKLLYYSLLFFVSGITIWFFDITKIICNPANHIIQGHQIWHILASLGVYFLLKYHLGLGKNSLKANRLLDRLGT